MIHKDNALTSAPLLVHGITVVKGSAFAFEPELAVSGHCSNDGTVEAPGEPPSKTRVDEG